MKKILVALSVVLSALAAKAEVPLLNDLQVANIIETLAPAGLDWKVGDQANYNLDMGGFLKGTMVMQVTLIETQGFWMQQDIDLMIQKQKVEVLIDKNNGQILKMIVNGQEQTPPKQDIEVLEVKESTITVPAGNFQVVYMKVKDKAQNNAISEIWANPKAIPMSGMAKMISQSQMGQVTIELTKFQRGN